MTRVSCRVKALRLGTDGGDTRGCRVLLEDVIVDLLPMSRFQVKTFVRWTRQRRRFALSSLLRPLSWSLDVLGCCVGMFSSRDASRWPRRYLRASCILGPAL